MVGTFLIPLFLAGFVAEALWGTDYVNHHLWPFLIGMTVSVAATWVTGKWLNDRPGRVIRDARSGQQVELKSAHDLFYIPFRFWAIIGGIVGFAFLIPLVINPPYDDFPPNPSSAPPAAALANVSGAAPDWHALLDQGRAAKKSGDFRRAEPLLQQALLAGEHALGSDSIAIAPVLTELGQVQRHREEWPAAEASLRRALALQESAHSRHSAEVALALDALGEVFADRSDASHAGPLLEEAQSILESLPHPSEDDRALILHDLAAVRYLQNRYDDAAALWRRALSIRERDDPNGSPTATTRYNLAMLADLQGHKDEARTLFQASLAASEKSQGPTHPDTGLALLRLAEWYIENDEDNAAAAVPLLERAVSIYDVAFSRSDVHLIESIEKLAALHGKLGHSKQAEALYVREIEVAEGLDSSEAHQAASSTHLRLAEIYNARGDRKNAAAQRAQYENARRDARDVSAVRSAFAAYKIAISNGHGEETAALLTASTVAHYDELRELALYGTRDALAPLSSMDLLNVLMLRHQIPVAQLRKFASGRPLIANLIDRGWIGSGEVESLTIVAIRINGDDAIVDLKTPTEATLDYRFHRESKAWKMDLARVIQFGSAQWDAEAKRAGSSIEDYLIQRLSAGEYGVVDASIWNPPMIKHASR